MPIPKGYNHSKEIKNKISKGLKKIYKEGHVPWNKGKKYKSPNCSHIPWNKGLTKETDIRIRKISEKLKGHEGPHFKHTKRAKNKIGLANKGKKKPWLSKMNKNSEFTKKRLKACIKHPNKSEQLLNQILQQAFPSKFKFVGNGSFIIENFNPDFINCNGQKTIIELFGDYWHNLPRYRELDKRKMKAYSKYGYRTLIIWEHELKDKEKLIEKLGDFKLA